MLDVFIKAGQDIINSLSPEHRLIVTLIFFTAVLVIYSIFIYYFYKFVARKNIIDLNLRQYGASEGDAFMKFLAVLLYILEYLVIFPLLTIFWFVVFSMFLLILSKVQDVVTILIISAALIASVRFTAYVSQGLSKDLAKMLPFTLLALFLTQPDFFSIILFVERIKEVPLLLRSVPYYLLFIILLEFVMRIGELTSQMFSHSSD